MGHKISALVTELPIDFHAAKLLDLPVMIEGRHVIIALNYNHSDFWAKRHGLESCSLSKIIHDNPVTFDFARRLGISRFALIQTDYFGGIGEQYATVYDQGQRVLEATEGSVNSALKAIGVTEANGLDAFDTIGLQQYRDFSDLFIDYYDDGEAGPNIASRIFSVQEACQFILTWEGIEIPLRGTPLPSVAHAVEPIVNLNNFLGHLWVSDNHCLRAALNSEDQKLSLFAFQDTILSPHEYDGDCCDGGIVTFAVENQGVWVLGYNPHDPIKLWVKRDWWDYSQVSQRNDWPKIREQWRRTETTVEEAIIFLLLSNYSMMRSTDESWDFDLDSRPKDATKLLWRSAEHPSIAFWTNDEQTTLHYEGSFLTIRR